MKNFLHLVLAFCLLTAQASAQHITPSDFKSLHQKEDSMKRMIKNIMIDSLTAGRMRSDSFFVKTLVRSLQVRNSFYFPFDSLKGIGKIYSPDSTFRIITWQLSFDDYYCRQRGAIQFKTPDGSLKLVPLRDYSEFTENSTDSVRTKDTWIGAVYYNIIRKQYNGRNYYTLFGFDANSVRSNKKWIEVLTFDAKGLPLFGAPFTFDKDSIPRKPQQRFSIEYKKDASTMVNYDADLDVILVDHLVSETDEPELAYTYVPDGDYEGFKWSKGQWQHVDKVFHEKLEDGQAPVPQPIKDDSEMFPAVKPGSKPVKQPAKTKGNF